MDLVAESAIFGIAVIENQLEKSNHDHLGKLVKYAAMSNAKVAIWIVSEPRSEHVKSITWLNEIGTIKFFLVKVQAVRIGDSDPAALFTVISGPSEASTEAGKIGVDVAGTETKQRQFWTGLLNRAKQKTKLHSGLSGGFGGFIGSPVGLPEGCNLNYVIAKKSSRCELYIDSGAGKSTYNELLFKSFCSHAPEIESAFGGQLQWQELPGKQACRIYIDHPNGGLTDEDRWAEIQENMIDSMIRLESSLRPWFTEATLATMNKESIEVE